MVEATRQRTADAVGAETITTLIAGGVLDAELAALVWLLIEGHVPLVVAARERLSIRVATLAALLDFLPVHARRVSLQGQRETFDWLPGAESLGWAGPMDADTAPDTAGSADWPAGAIGSGGTATHQRAEPADPRVPEIDVAGLAEPALRRVGDPGHTYLITPELGPGSSAGTWGRAARVLVRALQRGYGLGTTMHADSLEEVLGALADPPVSLGTDELRRLGTVLVLRDGRVVAAHYLRPLERDGAGHLQRRPPAVLATLNSARDAYEHFAWGLIPELAVRVGRSQPAFEREQDARAAFLSALASRGGLDDGDVRAALAAYPGPQAAPRAAPSG
jgi:hypothetical protein